MTSTMDLADMFAAAARVDYWNKMVQGWHYELKEWVVK